MSITRQFGTWSFLLYVTHSCTLWNYVNYGKVFFNSILLTIKHLDLVLYLSN
ncbi:hypothetical protein BDV40DRAFT_272863 [Aspergillus tamarii]|uniref:Uncharacterized protein n=1 Tax=Aspergillus tamarii TaxID=41984 RepID=A0A5N6UN79_ASPTM|nr:hypothetical protein BDV40DRAFT_272863 [Aspergillus tamarii]